jgi:hypothetical protein
MSLNGVSAEVPFTDLRVITGISGKYSLADVRNARGERRVFGCRVVSLSCYAMTLAAPVKGKIGDRVIAEIDRLGKLEGAIRQLLTRGFVMSIVANQHQRSSLATKIAWMESQKNHDAFDRRANRRTIPANPNSKIILADGRVENCLVLDLSVSGAAVSAGTVPDIGAVLAVGSVVGRVVRHFADGFAIEFVQRQHPTSVETMVVLGG